MTIAQRRYFYSLAFLLVMLIIVIATAAFYGLK